MSFIVWQDAPRFFVSGNKKSFRVVTWNLHGAASPLRQAAYLCENADIALLQECDANAARSQGVDIASYLAAESDLRYVHYFPTMRLAPALTSQWPDGLYGLVIASRFPLSNRQVRWLVPQSLRTFGVEPRVAGASTASGIRFATVHLPRVRVASDLFIQKIAISRLLRWIRTLTGAWIIGGDFNVDASAFAQMLRLSHTDAVLVSAPEPTFPRAHYPTASVRQSQPQQLEPKRAESIDFFLASPSLVVSSAVRLSGTVDSDHYPVLLTLNTPLDE
jgi:endonuclease/exonuclease/phosphatase family metal-dependent hydrolase